MQPVEQILDFPQIKGQAQPVYILRQALLNDRLPHAYLFEGPDGVGKKTAALALARTILCRKSESGNACGACPACHKTALRLHPGEMEQPDYPMLGHPDLGLIEPDGQFVKVEAVRKLQQRLNYKPFEGRLKIYIIDEADRMNSQSANCLLKTLEEPPDHCLLILVSSNPHQLLPTVRSRCQRLSFAPVCSREIASLVAARQNLSPAAGALIAEFAQGSLGLAVSLDPQPLLDLRETVFSWLSDGKFAPGQWISALAKEYSKDTADLQALVGWLILIYRDLLMLKHGAGGGRLCNADKLEILTRMSAAGEFNYFHGQLNRLQELKGHLQRNINPQLVLENIFISLSTQGLEKGERYQ